MNLALTSSKLIALATALFLLSANLDNIPDSPEALNSNPGSASLQLAHQPLPSFIDAVDVLRNLLLPPQIGTQYSLDPFVVIPPCGATRSLYSAADPSPPAA